MSRLSSLQGPVFDLVIIGGGIIGAGIARDAALRGLAVALVEARDFGSGTTSGSTRLIHGGLRYLEMFDFGLVRLDLRERETLLRIAPHLVRPLPFILPFYDASLWGRVRLRIGMGLYDLLSYDGSLPRHRVLSASELRREEPALNPQGLQGGALYYDAQAAMPERLCLENILDARRLGASVHNHAAVVGATIEVGRIAALTVEDRLDGDRVTVKARLVVNATGAWLDRVSAAIEPAREPRLRTTKGIHLACPPTTSRALAVPSAVDGRLVFVIPWLGYSWIGTTDLDYEDDPANVRATRAEVEYLKASVGRYVPALTDAPIHFTNAGVRALIRQEGHESSVSRGHRIVDHASAGLEGLVSIVGGKLTGYRGIAEEATDLVCRRLGHTGRSRTAELPLPGAVDLAAAGDGSDPLAMYGSRKRGVQALAAADPSLAERLHPAYPEIRAQAVFAAREEACLRLSDFLCRRTRLAFTPDQGAGAIEPAADLLARELGWSAARRAEEVADYRSYVARTQAYRHEGEPDWEGRNGRAR
ncbi:MAG TPA: glycerol-3-phosphate dehydrogenase/oxidase [Vicinamibacterales bacterium]